MGQIICCQYLGKTVTINGTTYSVEKTIGEGGFKLFFCYCILTTTNLYQDFYLSFFACCYLKKSTKTV